MMTLGAYTQLERAFERIYILGEVSSVLGWDQEVTMPDGANEGRARQKSELSVISHELITQPQLQEWIDVCLAKRDQLTAMQAANVREMQREIILATAVDAALVKALSEASSRTVMVWRDAKTNNNFKLVQPHLETLVNLSREASQRLAVALQCSAYEALFQQYEPYGQLGEVESIFHELEQFLPSFVEAVVAQQKPLLCGAQVYPQSQQHALQLDVLKALQFDFNCGRLDPSAHPFSTGSGDDLRITTRYSEDDFFQALMGTIHETGHAHYTKGLPLEWRYQPVGQARGLALHESQSLALEMQACRSDAFLSFLLPLLHKHFAAQTKAWSLADLRAKYLHVEKSFIRIEADEVTYPLHVILRFKLERALMDGDLQVADLPQAWNAMFQQYFGVMPPDDRRGCLQDIHWYQGSFGYFPTYTLGALAAAQLFAAAKKAEPTLLSDIARGDFTSYYRFMRSAVHHVGSLLSTREILEAATGSPLSASAYINHVKTRYGG